MGNIVIPGSSAQIVKGDVSRTFGTAGRVCIIGNFERGDANKPYFFKSASDALQGMGASASYSGTNIIVYTFKQDLENENYGATDCICVKTGTTVKASATLLDASSAVGLHVTAVSGGPWANGASGGLKISIGAGTISGQKVTIKLNDVIVDQIDNCANTTDIMNKINASDNYLVASGTSTELARTLATVTDTALAGGTETASPTTTDITNALATVLNESFDYLILTDTVDPTYLPTLKAWLDSKFALATPAIGAFALAESNNVATTLTNVGTTDSDNMFYFYQKGNVDNDSLSESEFVARMVAYEAGLAVNESSTNKKILDVTSITPTFKFGATDDGYALVNGGVTLLKLMTHENNDYGIVSSVTAIRDVDDQGKKVPTSELYATKIRNFCIKYLNLDDWKGRVGISTSIESALGELENRKQDLINQNIVKDIPVAITPDTQNSEIANVDFEFIIPGILKAINYRIKLSMEA